MLDKLKFTGRSYDLFVVSCGFIVNIVLLVLQYSILKVSKVYLGCLIVSKVIKSLQA